MRSYRPIRTQWIITTTETARMDASSAPQSNKAKKRYKFMSTPKILIVVEDGCASVVAATSEVEVHIVDKDTQSGFASHEEIGHYNPISDKDFHEAIEEHSCP